MKTLSVILLAAVSIATAGFAEAAPKKRTRNADRIGPYGLGAMGYSSFRGDQSQAEDYVLGQFEQNAIPPDDVTMETTEEDLGYNLSFGYRFTRYFAAELGLVSYGKLESAGHADVDTTEGVVPIDIKLAFQAGGPLISAIGILPVNDKIELFGRLGYLLTSAEREVSSRVDGRRGNLFGSIKGESQDVVLGLGAAYNVNQRYAVRLEYQQIDTLGQRTATGEEEVSQISVGMVIRF